MLRCATVSSFELFDRLKMFYVARPHDRGAPLETFCWGAGSSAHLLARARARSRAPRRRRCWCRHIIAGRRVALVTATESRSSSSAHMPPIHTTQVAAVVASGSVCWVDHTRWYPAETHSPLPSASPSTHSACGRCGDAARPPSRSKTPNVCALLMDVRVAVAPLPAADCWHARGKHGGARDRASTKLLLTAV